MKRSSSHFFLTKIETLEKYRINIEQPKKIKISQLFPELHMTEDWNLAKIYIEKLHEVVEVS